ncbi:hypothetical protein EOD42_14125 [Rhodovarius crocodyli]|uniref:Uncharacterized protein n=1 Tax=Rhodovarius crocodyli TaxID=1979269 RepID=A0A437MF49_9PROT|nr:hypothetical protein [Rhodovarius crocodyli]RVT96245.1 hypothetical protein EOD42_14125 [Rhodovarius crocodyli]
MPELDLPPPPPELHFALPAFRDLCNRRPFSQGVPLPLPATEILAWSQLTGQRMTQRDFTLVTVLDHAWLKAIRSEEPH